MTARYSVVFFDIDSTLVTIEGIDVLSGGSPEIAALTEAAMSGEIPIDEVYARRLDLVRPTRQQVEKLGQAYLDALLPEASEVIRQLLDSQVDVHLMTAGIEQAVRPLAERLGVHAVHAVPLFFDSHGNYRDFDRHSLLTRARGKETVVLDVRARTHGKAMYVGDGVTDLDVKDAVDSFVGFGGVRVRERVRREANVFIKNLNEILPLVFEAGPRAEVQQMKRTR